MSEPSGAAAPAAQPSGAGTLNSAQRAMMLIMMTMVAVCSQLDRSIMGMVLEPIKNDFQLSDGQLGALAGLAFAIAHAVVAIPLGHLADKTSRKTLIGICLAVWSGMTALCGLAANFVQLFLARMGVGAGEAGGQAASLAVVSDLYSEKRRATAIAIFYLSGPIGAILAGILAGPITAEHGWRTALILAGVPGLIMTIVLFAFGKEPPRETQRAEVATKAPGFAEVLHFIQGQRALLHMYAGLALITFVLSGTGSFAVSFFIRYHGIAQRDIAAIMGGVGALTILVNLGSGILADRLSKNDPRWRLWLIIPVEIAITILMLVAFTVGGAGVALPAYLCAFLLSQVWIAPAFATAQSLSPSRMRSTSAGIMFVINNLLGFGFGPVILGSLSDAMSLQFGAGGLRASLIVVTLLALWACVHLYLASRTLRADLARAAEAS